MPSQSRRVGQELEAAGLAPARGDGLAAAAGCRRPPGAAPALAGARRSAMLQNIMCSSSTGTQARTRTCTPRTPVGIIV